MTSWQDGQWFKISLDYIDQFLTLKLISRSSNSNCQMGDSFLVSDVCNGLKYNRVLLQVMTKLVLKNGELLEMVVNALVADVERTPLLINKSSKSHWD